MTPVDLAVRHVAETGSTNSDLLAEVRASAAAGEPFAPRLLVAGTQTAGRGRHGRGWSSSPGASLTFSLAWPFPAATDLSGLSLAVGVAVADALDPGPARPDAPCRIGLKWPNDLWLMDRFGAGHKLGGILIETAPCGADARAAVVGVGLNVREQAVGDAASGVAWLGELDAAATPASALDALRPDLVAALHRFAHDGFAAFAERFAGRDLLRGRVVAGAAAAAGAVDVAGVAVGISSSGELLVDTGTGIRPVRSGEVRLRPLETAQPLPC